MDWVVGWEEAPELYTTDTIYDYRGKLKKALRSIIGNPEEPKEFMRFTPDYRVALGLRDPGDGYTKRSEQQKIPIDSNLAKRIILIESIVMMAFAKAYECEVLPIGAFKFITFNYGGILDKGNCILVAKTSWNEIGSAKNGIAEETKSWDCRAILEENTKEVRLQLGRYLCDSFAGEWTVAEVLEVAEGRLNRVGVNK